MNNDSPDDGTSSGTNNRENEAQYHKQYIEQMKQQNELLERIALGVETQSQQLRAIKDQLIRINF